MDDKPELPSLPSPAELEERVRVRKQAEENEARKVYRRGQFQPGSGGRPKGTKNKASKEAREFCQGIVCTRWYKASLIRRIRNNTLAPAVEVMINHYARGKPPDVVEVEVNEQQDLRELSDMQLAKRAAELSREFLTRKDEAAANAGEDPDRTLM